MHTIPLAANCNIPEKARAYIYVGECLKVLRSMPSNSVDLCVTSPPYYGNLRDYGHPDQYGQEPTLAQYLNNQVAVFREIYRILKPNGNLWINIGDKYDRGNLIGVPWHLAFALQQDGWILREDVIWSKKNCVPEGVRTRTTRSHEYFFHFSKCRQHYFDVEAIMVKGNVENIPKKVSANSPRFDGTNGGNMQGGKYMTKLLADIAAGKEYMVRKRSVWEVHTASHDGRIYKHNAMYPEALIEPIILSSSPLGGTVIDPFGGAGTSVAVANRLQRHGRMVELNPTFAETAKKRLERLNSAVSLVRSNLHYEPLLRTPNIEIAENANQPILKAA